MSAPNIAYASQVCWDFNLFLVLPCCLIIAVLFLLFLLLCLLVLTLKRSRIISKQMIWNSTLFIDQAGSNLSSGVKNLAGEDAPPTSLPETVRTRQAHSFSDASCFGVLRIIERKVM